jgi:uncharacterized membrane protein
VIVYLALFGVLIERTSPEEAATWARRGEPNDAIVLLIVMVISVASLVAVAAMLNRLPPDRSRWEVNLHMMASLLAVILSWLLSHVYFGLHYMRIYYDDTRRRR